MGPGAPRAGCWQAMRALVGASQTAEGGQRAAGREDGVDDGGMVVSVWAVRSSGAGRYGVRS